jgi:hypothetical protein
MTKHWSIQKNGFCKLTKNNGIQGFAARLAGHWSNGHFIAISIQNLVDTKKKVRIKADVRQITGTISYCSKLVFIDTLDGKTLPQSKKLKIDDYR